VATTRLAITLGLCAASLAISACSQEDYYCDESGCYYCDGLGCRDVNPPGRAPCTCGDRECGTGTACTTLGCTVECTTSDQCARGTECERGLCVSPRETAPTASIECAPCTTTAECEATDPGTICVDGACVPPARPTCDTTAPCAAGRVCVDGECRLPEETCRFTSECGDERVCVDQHCTYACPDVPCPTGSTCTDGYCRETPTVDCTTSTMCGAGEVCIDGSCWSGCDSADDCGVGRYCGTDGRCRLDDVPHPVCSPETPCASGAVCVDGVCRSPCETATDCRRFDEQLTFCVERLCFTTSEATSNCSASSECNAGQDCVDGNCR
jgi:hypothetical protein